MAGGQWLAVWQGTPRGRLYRRVRIPGWLPVTPTIVRPDGAILPPQRHPHHRRHRLHREGFAGEDTQVCKTCSYIYYYMVGLLKIYQQSIVLHLLLHRVVFFRWQLGAFPNYNLQLQSVFCLSFARSAKKNSDSIFQPHCEPGSRSWQV